MDAPDRCRSARVEARALTAESCSGSGTRVHGGGAPAIVYCPVCDAFFENLPREAWPKGTLYAGKPNSVVVPQHVQGRRR